MSKPARTLRILAIDPATNCGWAHSSGVSGTWDLSVRRDESTGMRLIRFRGKLNEFCGEGLDLVVFEAARNCAPKMQGALVIQSEIQGVLKTWCHDNGVEFRGYSPTEIKKHATGKGNANKQAMIEAAEKRWPDARIVDDNQADALWILSLAETQLLASQSTARPADADGERLPSAGTQANDNPVCQAPTGPGEFGHVRRAVEF